MNKILTWDFLIENAPPTLRDYADRLKNIPQSYNWHPEGNVEIHSKIVLNRASQFSNNDLIMAAFFHDLGKVDVTKRNKKGGFSAHGHETISAQLVKYNESWIKDLGCNPEKVKWIVENHMRVKYIDSMKEKKRTALVNHKWFIELMAFSICDSRDRLRVSEIFNVKGNIFLFLLNKIKTFFRDK